MNEVVSFSHTVECISELIHYKYVLHIYIILKLFSYVFIVSTYAVYYLIIKFSKMHTFFKILQALFEDTAANCVHLPQIILQVWKLMILPILKNVHTGVHTALGLIIINLIWKLTCVYTLEKNLFHVIFASKDFLFSPAIKTICSLIWIEHNLCVEMFDYLTFIFNLNLKKNSYFVLICLLNDDD